MEPPRDGDACLGVVALTEVLPDPPTVLGPELPLQERQELRAPHLLTAARAEDRPDQPADRNDVVACPTPERQAGLAVLRVDPGDVGVDDPDGLAPSLPLGAEEAVLAGKERLGLRAGAEGPTREREPERVDAGRVERRDATGAAEQLHDQLPVGGGRPACAEGDVRGGPPPDVRHAPPVPRDRHPRAGPLRSHGSLGAEAERRALEEPPQIGVT